MKRSTRFLVGLAAAAVTYGSLFALVGPNRFGDRSWHGPRHAYGHYRCAEHPAAGRNHWQEQPAAPPRGDVGP